VSGGTQGASEPTRRITVPLIAKAAADLYDLAAETGLPETDLVNRALTLYAFIESEVRAGAKVTVRRDGRDYEIALL
jgi:hypothetical protein